MLSPSSSSSRAYALVRESSVETQRENSNRGTAAFESMLGDDMHRVSAFGTSAKSLAGGKGDSRVSATHALTS
jgi:hypothetical protein